MHHSSLIVKPAVSAMTVTSRAATPRLDERVPQTIKSLFTLADVATRRRANRNFRKLTINTVENHYNSAESARLLNLRRSKSSGDVAVLGEGTRTLNVVPEEDQPEIQRSAVRTGKSGRSRAATTPSTPPSRIPKAKSPTCPSSMNLTESFSPPVIDDDMDSVPDMTLDCSDFDTHSMVDDALFVMLTLPQTPAKKTAKSLTLAAHTPSLPKIASPFSPRTISSWSATQSSASTSSSPGTGHTNASLHLTKSHWELRYEAWIRSLRTHRIRRPCSARSATRPVALDYETPSRSRFPEPPTNPALFPRAGMLTPKALRQNSVDSDEDSRSMLELDWAVRAWPMDKIQRTLFVHDMDVRTWFPIAPSKSDMDMQYNSVESTSMELDLTRMTSGHPDEEREKERVLRRWEWDWELRWRVIEDMVEVASGREKTEHEYDVFLAKDTCQANEAYYGGCSIEALDRRNAQEEDWEWNEDAMEIDAVL
ncbi:hypothetical protein K439DRAFT_260299 [Ramaria rubella]|nr:hypothetical protein K439DRAFT_260299 [Ramaria rubella]